MNTISHRTLLLLVPALVAAVVGAAPALAHNVLRSSTPAGGAVLPTPPADVRLEFDQSVVTLGTEVAVTGPPRALTLEPVVVDGATVRQPLPAGLPAGAYTVQWRATSSDGHPVSGEFAFTAEAASPAPDVTSTPEPTTSAPSATIPDETPTEPAPQPSPAAEDGSGLPAGAWVAIGVGALAALGGGAAALASKGRGPTRQD